MRTLITTISLFLITILSYGQIISPTNVVHTIPTPLQNTGGVTSLDGYLWTTNLNNIITKLSPVDGQVVKTLYVDESDGNKRFYGISFDGTHLWATEVDYRTIYQIDTINGTIINQFQIGSDWFNHPYNTRDIHYESGYIWYSLDFVGTVDTIYKCDTLGNVLYKKALRLLPPSGVNITEVSGMTFGGGYLWIVNSHTGWIFSLDTANNYTAYDMLRIPGDVPYCYGCISALSYDNGYLRLSNNETDTIYKIDVASLTSLNEYNDGVDIKVFPNPSNGFITIETLEDIHSVNICNLNGEIVLTQKPINGIINFDLPSGYYIVKVETTNHLINKLIKIN